MLAGASAAASAPSAQAAEPASAAPAVAQAAAIPGAAGAAAPAPMAAGMPAGMPAMPGMPTMPGMPAGFDPSTFSQQLQQLQQMQAAVGGSHGSDLRPAEQGGGFLAGKIFIPAKDEGKMFIGGLNWETTDESMKNYFSQFGEVTECTVMRDNNTGRSRGFGFLTFKDPKIVSVVLAREHFLDGKIIDPKRAIPREEQEKTAKIFVGGVGPDVTENDFQTFFEQYGTVIDAQLMMDKDTGRPRGFGFVTFDSEDAVETIVAEKFLDLKGKPIEVKRAEPRGRDAVRDDGRNGRAGFAMPQANMYGYGMDPTMMSQYYQQMQAYMQQMQDMMQQGGAANPMMQMYQQMMQGQMAGGAANAAPSNSAPNPQSAPSDSQSPSAEDYDDRRRDRMHRRGNEERRRSRSPGLPSRGGRRRPANRDRDRDRHYNRR